MLYTYTFCSYIILISRNQLWISLTCKITLPMAIHTDIHIKIHGFCYSLLVEKNITSITQNGWWYIISASKKTKHRTCIIHTQYTANGYSAQSSFFHFSSAFFLHLALFVSPNLCIRSDFYILVHLISFCLSRQFFIFISALLHVRHCWNTLSLFLTHTIIYTRTLSLLRNTRKKN